MTNHKSKLITPNSIALKKIPDSPGVYLFYGRNGEILYVGKATSLKARVKSYFQGANGTRPIEQFVEQIKDIKFKTTESVLEAIILEANLIKEKQPKYNVLGRDDKSWNYIVITKDDYPQVKTRRQHEMKTKKQENKEAKKQHLFQFGPYPGLNTKAAMKLLRKLFNFSDCQKIKKQKPCFYYQMGQCLGVCTGEITPAEYKKKVIRPLVTFLKGRKRQLIKSLEIKMQKEAKAENFEEAARLRNQIESLQRIQDVALLNKSFMVDQTSDFSPIDRRLKSEVRIEGYDISNLGSTDAVGSMVVFVDGEPGKRDYRKFKIKTVKGQSDVDCLEEVLRRRLKHGEWLLPNIFLIDGGKPQVNRAVKILKEAGVSRPVVGIAKGPERKKNEIVLGKITDNKNKLTDFSRWVYNNVKLLIQVRDEAHRFALEYQRQLRKLRH